MTSDGSDMSSKKFEQPFKRFLVDSRTFIEKQDRLVVSRYGHVEVSRGAKGGNEIIENRRQINRKQQHQYRSMAPARNIECLYVVCSMPCMHIQYNTV